MILIKKRKKAQSGKIKTKIRFAFLPKYIPSDESAYSGEWIWLEKYVITYRYGQDYIIFNGQWYKFQFGCRYRWSKTSTEKYLQAVLNKFAS
jgi:hypothetical protein